MNPYGARSHPGRLARAIARAAGIFRRGHREELAPSEAYRLWAPNYPPRAHNVLMEVEERAVFDLLPAEPRNLVVDLACGTGRYALALGADGPPSVGVDLSLAMLLHAPPGFARVQGDLRRVPLRSGCADLVVCGLAVGHVEELAAAVAEMARILSPGGTAVYSDFHPEGRARGWRRDFRAPDGRLHAVSFTVHDEAAHREAIRRAGLEIEAIREAGVGAELARANPEAARFRRRWGDTPVVLVVRARKA